MDGKTNERHLGRRKPDLEISGGKRGTGSVRKRKKGLMRKKSLKAEKVRLKGVPRREKEVGRKGKRGSSMRRRGS